MYEDCLKTYTINVCSRPVEMTKRRKIILNNITMELDAK